MNNTIQREIFFPQPREQVWHAITDRAMLAEWMFPNDFEPRVGHRFNFHVPANPKMNFDGLTVRCEVLECEPPSANGNGRLAFSWSAGGAVENTRVSFRLEPDSAGTRVFFEHSGFDISHPFGGQALKGAEFGWANMFKQLAGVIAKSSLPKPDISKMNYNPANFAHHMGTGPWTPGYAVYYAISFYDAATQSESPRSEWWGPNTDPKKLYGGFGLIHIPVDPTGQATARRIWRKFEGEPERMIQELPDNTTTKFQDGVL